MSATKSKIKHEAVQRAMQFISYTGAVLPISLFRVRDCVVDFTQSVTADTVYCSSSVSVFFGIRVLVLVYFIHLITAAIVFFSVSVFFGKEN